MVEKCLKDIYSNLIKDKYRLLMIIWRLCIWVIKKCKRGYYVFEILLKLVNFGVCMVFLSIFLENENWNNSFGENICNMF